MQFTFIETFVLYFCILCNFVPLYLYELFIMEWIVLLIALCVNGERDLNMMNFKLFQLECFYSSTKHDLCMLCVCVCFQPLKGQMKVVCLNSWSGYLVEFIISYNSFHPFLCSNGFSSLH